MCDHELLCCYARDRSERAFATLVERHLSLVYSAARRQVRSPHLAEDVAQAVFLDLARQAATLPPDQSLVAWLHVVTRRTAIDLVRAESRRTAREHAAAEGGLASELPSSTATTPPRPSHWLELEPLLDEAVESLPEPDRTAILLRFFENKSLRDIGSALGTTDDAAQKRVTRALDRLRDFFLRRGLTVTAAGLTADLSAHALQIAPASLGATIASAVSAGPLAVGAVLASSGLGPTVILPHGLVAIIVASTLGLAVYETGVIARQRDELAAAPGQAAHLTALSLRLLSEQTAADQRLATSRRDLAKLQRVNLGVDTPLEAAIEAWLARIARLKALATQRADLGIPELLVLTDNDWFAAAKSAPLDTEEQVRAAFRKLHDSSRGSVAGKFQGAITRYAATHGGQLPRDPASLAPLIEPPLPAALFDRYELLQRGELGAVPTGEWLLAERLPIAQSFDNRVFVTAQSHGTEDLTTVPDRLLRPALRAFAEAHRGALPTEPAQLLVYFRAPPGVAALKSFLERPKSDFTPEALKKLLQSD